MTRVIGEPQKPKRPTVFLHLGFGFESTPGDAERALIEQTLNKAKDWLRYSPNCWLIYTSRSPDSWFKEILAVPGIKENATFFICEVDLDSKAGWLRESAWAWINKDRSRSA